jgi:dTDP-4-dehydrorhamnose reductase
VRILLTGSTGQIGQSLAPRLAELGELVVPSRSELDLADPSAILAFVDDVRPAFAVNAAGYTAVDSAEQDAVLAQAVNGNAPGVLAQAMLRHGGALIHYSTDYVFDGAQTAPYAEDDPTGPLNVYGRTKLDGEQRVAASGVRHVIFRISWIYSAVRSNFLLTMLRLGRDHESISVVDDQHGAPTPAAVVADATLRVLARAGDRAAEQFGKYGGLVHLGCRGETTWYGFAEAIFAEARRMGLPMAVRQLRPTTTAAFPRPARRPMNSRLDLGRLAAKFEIETPNWRDALHEQMALLRPSLDGIERPDYSPAQ